MQSPLVERLGLCATKETAQNTLQGKRYNDEGVAEDTNEVLKYLMYKEGTEGKFRSKPLDVMECQVGWKNVKERTSSSMKSGAYFGH